MAPLDEKGPEVDCRLLLQCLPGIVLVLGENGTIVYRNAATARKFSSEFGELLGQNFTELLHTRDQDSVEAALEYSWANGSPLHLDLQITTGIEEWCWFELSGVVLPPGPCAGILLCLHDINENRENESLLSNAAQTWRTTFDSIGDAVCVLGADWRIKQCNRAMITLANRPLREIIGQTPCVLIHSGRQPLEGCPRERLLSARERQLWEYEESGRRFLVSLDPVLSEKGVLLGAVHAVKDLTGASVGDSSAGR